MMRILLCLVFLFLPGICLAQQKDNPPVDLESFIERLFPVQDEDIDYEAIYEALFQLYQNPINLNQANSEVLQASYLLSPLQVGSFLAYREKFGPLISIYELQAIPEFDLALIEALVPFVTLGEINRKPVPFWQRLKQEENAYLLFRHRRTWERRRGFTPADTLSNGRMSTRYLGDPNELYLRFRIQHPRDFSLGVTLEKDAGEQFTWDGKTARYGFNFFSFHFTRYQVGKWRTIALGDFQASFGQGLVFGAGYTLGKGAETVPTVRRSSIGILPYTAALEFGFFRGLGLTRQWKNWTV
ncbi:MAG: helix-hairpin-helix domain-containing protein, partial [Cytophagales bacterium]